MRVRQGGEVVFHCSVYVGGGCGRRMADCHELVCFFFQAEDGIRGGRVTGVQTCALPISSRTAPPTPSCWRNVTRSATTRKTCGATAATGGTTPRSPSCPCRAGSRRRSSPDRKSVV